MLEDCSGVDTPLDFAMEADSSSWAGVAAFSAFDLSTLSAVFTEITVGLVAAAICDRKRKEFADGIVLFLLYFEVEDEDAESELCRDDKSMSRATLLCDVTSLCTTRCAHRCIVNTLETSRIGIRKPFTVKIKVEH